MPYATIGTRVALVGKRVLFLRRPGDPTAGDTFSRPDATTCATLREGPAGVLVTVAPNVLRDRHYIGSVRTILLEGGDSNLVPASENHAAGSWTNNGVTLTTGQAGPDNNPSATLWHDNIAGSAVKHCTVPFVTNGTKIFRLLLAPAAVPNGSRITIVGAAERGRLQVTWASGVPSATVTGGASVLATVAWANGFYELLIACTGMVAADTNQLYLYPGNGTTAGDVYAQGLFASDAPVVRSYIKTTAGTVVRQPDRWILPGVATTAPATLFYRYYDLATFAWVNAVARYVSLTPIAPPVDRAYSHVAILRGGLTAAQGASALRIA